MTRTCETCPNVLPPKKKTGPPARFCAECQRRKKAARESARRPKKGYPKERPAHRKYLPGWTSPNGHLVLVRRIVGDPDRAWFTCGQHVSKVLHIRNVKAEVTLNCAEREHHRDPRITSTPAYSTVHHRKATAEGSASEHPCIRCGERAEDFAYLHGTHDVLSDDTGREAGLPFSADPEQLAPFCRPCHHRWDDAKQRTAGDGLSLAHVALWLATHDTHDEKDLNQ
ncbi:hypothetical protein [Streptomyces sp. enrichment culture]|uniref:hypothetical protein n=1 Tax=Streptomyces sp. enrichment culture TaxID=1795815 RepID=UPI003F544B3C